MTDTSMYRAIKNMAAQKDEEKGNYPHEDAATSEKTWEKFSRGMKHGDRLPEQERSVPFTAQPDREIDGHTFTNIDPRKEWAILPADALRKYDKKHYDNGGNYDHWDPKDKSYWRLKRNSPTS